MTELKNMLTDLSSYIAQNDRHQIFQSHLVDHIITAASALRDEAVQLATIKALRPIATNQAEVALLLETSVLYFTIVILQETQSPVLQQNCLDLLAWLAQTDDCTQALISQHKLPSVVIRLADSIYSKVTADAVDETVLTATRIGQLMFVMCMAPKAATIFARLGAGSFFLKVVQVLSGFKQKLTPLHDDLLQVALLVIERLSSDKLQAQYLVRERCDLSVLSLIQSHAHQVTSTEATTLACNVLATFAVTLGSTFTIVEVDAPKTLLDLAQTEGAELRRYAISALVEIMYANKGQKGANIATMLRHVTGTVDETLQVIMRLGKQLISDSEAVKIWAVLVRVCCTVPRTFDYVREAALGAGLLQLSLEMLASGNVELNSKSAVLEAMDAALCVQNVPKEVLLRDVTTVNAVLPRLKREYQSQRNKSTPQAGAFKLAAENARSVLEKLGHTEGRDNKKFTMYGMIIIGCAILIGSLINLVR